MKHHLLERWQRFDQRVQTFLAASSLVFLVFLIYAYLWLPIQQANEKFVKEIPKKELQLSLMKIQAAEIESKRNQFHLNKASKEGITASIERSAKDQGIVLEKLVDQTDSSGNGLHVQIPSIAFDAWIKWIESLQVNHGVRVVSCQVSPNSKVGEVKVDVVFGVQN